MSATDTPSLDFWYEFASTYSYPAAMRVEDAARAAGVALRWRPFLLGPIFVAQGWNDSPFNVYPVKGRYMWRDLARVCAKQGLPLRQPSRFPRSGLLAARVALVAADDGFVGDFTRAVYRASFAEDREIAEREVIADVLRSIGRDADAVLERAQAPANKERLKAQNEEAVALGIFGAPTFVVTSGAPTSVATPGELFWGNDRLEDALAWARGERPAVAP